MGLFDKSETLCIIYIEMVCRQNAVPLHALWEGGSYETQHPAIRYQTASIRDFRFSGIVSQLLSVLNLNLS